MALQSSGSISLNQIHVEAGGSSGTSASLNDADIRGLIGLSSGASNAFSAYYGAASSAPTASLIQDDFYESGDGFPSTDNTNKWLDLGSYSGTKLVVGCVLLAGGSSTTANSFMSIGNPNTTGEQFTLAARRREQHPNSADNGGSLSNLMWDVAIYYVVTSRQGQNKIFGDGGSGRSMLHFYEVSGYNSSTPYTTDTAINTNNDATLGITVDSQYNGVTIGAAMSFDSPSPYTHTVTNDDAISTFSKQDASEHTSFYDNGTSSGNITYTYTNTGDTQAQPMTMVTASWK